MHILTTEQVSGVTTTYCQLSEYFIQLLYTSHLKLPDVDQPLDDSMRMCKCK